MSIQDSTKNKGAFFILGCLFTLLSFSFTAGHSQSITGASQVCSSDAITYTLEWEGGCSGINCNLVDYDFNIMGTGGTEIDNGITDGKPWIKVRWSPFVQNAYVECDLTLNFYIDPGGGAPLVSVTSPSYARTGNIVFCENPENVVLSEPLTENSVVLAGGSITLAPGFSTNGFTFSASLSDIYTNAIPVISYTAPSSYAPAYDDDENYIVTLAPKDAMTSIPSSHDPVSLTENIQYFDGLGRAMQAIAIKASPTGKDIIQHIEYDDFGRQDKDYLPYTATSGSGAFVDPTGGIVSAIDNFYPNTAGAIADDDGYPYAERTYDNSPLNRVLEQGAPGSPWQIDKVSGVSTFNGNTVRTTYTTNTTNEVRKLTVDVSTNNCTGGASSYYTEETLFVTQVIDENGHSTREYTDKEGRTILKIVDFGGLNLKTYYVYDDFGLLRYVLPPKLVAAIGSSDVNTISDDIFNSLAYYYEYDARKRMTMKQIPGAGKLYMVYDKRDRLVATQDANMRKNTETDYTDDDWLITKYDVLNRPVMTCLLANTNKTQAQMQTEASGFIIMGESISASDISTSPYYGYSHDNSFPDLDNYSVEVLSITYYDTYDFDNNGTEDFGNGYAYTPSEAAFLETSTKSTRVKGLVTGTRTKVLNAPTGIKDMLLTVNYYDDKGRVIQAVADNHAHGFDLASTDYRFNGEVKQTVYTHMSDFDDDAVVDGIDEDITLTETYMYDHAGRLLETELGVNDRNKNINTSQVLAANRYNELGELIEKYSSISGTTAKVASQKTDYRYNIRGWLTKINEPDLSGTDGDLFGMELAYNTSMASLGANAIYNGNISHIKWRNYEDATTKAYGFAYDQVNRLLLADYGEEASGWANTAFDVYGKDNGVDPRSSISYDDNGNIKYLRRNSSSGSALHEFTNYEYNGNQLTRIWENSTIQYEYKYDANGNMGKDAYKGIDTVIYNHLNLPETVSFDETGNNSIGYVYDAAGAKHVKLLTENGTPDSRTDYLGSFVYVDNALTYILTSEGRLIRTNDTYVYEYQLKDHLGNTRMAFNGYDGGGIDPVQANDYYPFGLRHEPVALENDNKYLYNGKEWQDDVVGGNSLEWYDYGARMYDPILGRWHVVDPMVENNHYEHSPYTYVYNNPIKLIDPMGLDSIVVNNEGNVVNVNKRDGDHIIYDEEGNQIDLNDPENDQKQINDILPEDRYNYNYSRSPVKLFTKISDKEILEYMIDADVIKHAFDNALFPDQKYVSGYFKAHGKYDFAITLYYDYGIDNEAQDVGIFRIKIKEGTGGLYILGSNNTGYNLHDAGNFLTGKAFNFSGYSEAEIRNGAHINEILHLRAGDSKADQRAISAGYKYTISK